jgi:membrane peptidoglycan carboxypeptidase
MMERRCRDALLQLRHSPVTQRRGGRRLGDAIACVLLLCTAAALIWNLHDTHFPSAAEITSQRVIVLQTEDGRDLLTKGSFRLAPIAAKDMPVDVINAIVSIEDRHFYRHGGIEVPSMLRALGGNIKAGHIVAGGSTITQQLVKILFLGPRRTYGRKIQEAVLARWVEYHLTKDEILTSI